MSSRRSTRSTKSTRSSRSRNRHPRSSEALINGLDELDLRIAALITDDNERHITGEQSSIMGDSSYASVGSRDFFNSCDPACLITNIVQINRNHRDTPSNSILLNKSTSGRSSRSIQEVKECEIARTVLRQSKEYSNTMMCSDNDAVSVVSTFTTGDILGDLTDNEDSKSVRSMRSTRSRKSRSRSKSRQRNPTSSVILKPVEPTRDRRRRPKSVPSGLSMINLANPRNEGESDRLYNAFMKNLSREERIAHDTKILSSASNVRAEISAANISKKSSSTVGNWATDLFENSYETNSKISSSNNRRIEKPSMRKTSSAPENITFSEINSCHKIRGQVVNQKIIDFKSNDTKVSKNISSLNSVRRRMSSREGNIQPFDSFGFRAENDVQHVDGFGSFGESSNIVTTPRFSFSDDRSSDRFPLQNKNGGVDSPARDAIAVRMKPLPRTSENSFVPQVRSKLATSKKKRNQWTDFNAFDTTDSNEVAFLSTKTNKGTNYRRHQINVGNAGNVLGSSETGNDDPFSIRSGDVTDSFTKEVSFQQNTRINNDHSDDFYPDPFSTSDPSLKRNCDESFVGFAGFGKSKGFESISGWDTDGKTNVDTSMKSALSDESPTGVSEFDSEWLRGGRDDRNVWV